LLRRLRLRRAISTLHKVHCIQCIKLPPPHPIPHSSLATRHFEGHLFAKRRSSFSKTKRFFLQNEGHRFLLTPNTVDNQAIAISAFWREFSALRRGENMQFSA